MAVNTCILEALTRLIEAHLAIEDEPTILALWLNPEQKPEEPVRLLEIIPTMKNVQFTRADPFWCIGSCYSFPYQLSLCLGNKKTMLKILKKDTQIMDEIKTAYILFGDISCLSLN